ncbi:MAG: AlkA N-terminal domain-containing protein, partial [Gammaproteobacteria bacterium]|nr:AlkA N-terminal domain-containing protein [Gammaproteobacteria bacterium]
AGWRGTASTVSRGLALIAEGALNDSDVEALADRLGVGARHLRRLFRQHVGAAPVAVAQAQRILFAKRLLSETELPITDIALAAGFGSVRRFNETMKRAYGQPPSRLRRAARAEGGTSANSADSADFARTSNSAVAVTLKLPFTKPYDWTSMLDFLARRAVPGVETVDSGRYRRTIAVDDASGAVDVGLTEDGAHLEAHICISRIAALAGVVARLRRVFDVDAEIGAIGAHLCTDALLAPAIAARPGLRVPGAWSTFELAVRAILGQQVSVAGARTLAARVVERCGEPVELPESARMGEVARLFPSAERLADADLSDIGMPGARARAISSMARAVAEDASLLRPRATLEESVERLCALPGVGAWTAHYIAMRGLGEPDAFPSSDLGVLRSLADADGRRPSPAEALERAEAWRPWRAYAVLHLWLGDDAPGATHRSAA